MVNFKKIPTDAESFLKFFEDLLRATEKELLAEREDPYDFAYNTPSVSPREIRDRANIELCRHVFVATIAESDNAHLQVKAAELLLKVAQLSASHA